MKVVILYRPQSEHARRIDEFTHEFQRRQPTSRLELIDVDSRDGTATASLYDVLSYPAILALTDDGQVLKTWMGEEMPLLDELSYYTH